MKILQTFLLLAAALTARGDSIVDGLAIPATGATNAAIVFQLRDQVRAALQMTSTLASTGNVVASFALSLDGVNFETTPSLSITNTSAGTNLVTTILRFDPSCLRAIKLLSVTNSAASPATLSVEISTSRRN